MLPMTLLAALGQNSREVHLTVLMLCTAAVMSVYSNTLPFFLCSWIRIYMTPWKNWRDQTQAGQSLFN